MSSVGQSVGFPWPLLSATARRDDTVESLISGMTMMDNASLRGLLSQGHWIRVRGHDVDTASDNVEMSFFAKCLCFFVGLGKEAGTAALDRVNLGLGPAQTAEAGG